MLTPNRLRGLGLAVPWNPNPGPPVLVDPFSFQNPATAPYQWKGEPAGYSPSADPNNPCYLDPRSTTIVASPPSAECIAWQQAHGTPVTMTYTYQPGFPGGVQVMTSGSASGGSFLQQNGLMIAGLAIAAVILFAVLK